MNWNVKYKAAGAETRYESAGSATGDGKTKKAKAKAPKAKKIRHKMC